MNSIEESLQKLNRLVEQIERYRHAVAVLSFDRNTICPEKAWDDQDQTINFLCTRAYEIEKSPEFIALVEELHRLSPELEPADKKLIDELFKSIADYKNVSPELYAEAQKLGQDAYTCWIEAKRKNDYSVFCPALEANVRMTKKLLSLRPQRRDTFYDDLIDDYERGFTTADYDRFFQELKEKLLPLLKRIVKSPVKIRTDFLHRPIPLEKQERFSHYLMDLIGFDSSSGMLSTTEHPFTSSLARHDTRITTHYYLDNFISNCYSVIHEGGHAIFGQNEPSYAYDHHINDTMSMAMHESVSRFYENRIGRSREFIHLIYPELISLFADELGDVAEEELYLGVNAVHPSLIRTEADELTYSLHIIIRYELEKEFINQEVDFATLKDRWNDLYEEYLGVRPTDDASGILQDVHWTDSYGYFPTYAIGNAYNAMYLKKMEEELDVKGLILSGEIKKINEWMRDHVFMKADLLYPKEWIFDITGRSLDPADYLRYLEEKYSDIYQLK